MITTPIEYFDTDALVTSDGCRYPIDTCVLATGFQDTDFLIPMTVNGVGAQQLHDQWRDGAEAYLGIAVSGFSNFFMMYGPNTNLGHNSIIFMLECQTRYIMQCLKLIFERDLFSFAVKTEAMTRYNRNTQSLLEKMAWTGSCGSWYKKRPGGRVINNWPGTTPAYFWRTLRPALKDFEMKHRSTASNAEVTESTPYVWSTCL